MDTLVTPKSTKAEKDMKIQKEIPLVKKLCREQSSNNETGQTAKRTIRYLLDHTMKMALKIIMRSFVIYLVFAFFVIVFGMANFRRNGNFRFWDGEEMSRGQDAIFVFVQCILIVVSGYSAFKRAKHDWKLWKKLRQTRQPIDEDVA